MKKTLGIKKICISILSITIKTLFQESKSIRIILDLNTLESLKDKLCALILNI
jgi:hypothetical protein